MNGARRRVSEVKKQTAEPQNIEHRISKGGFASLSLSLIYTAFHKNIPAGISGCKKKRLNNGTFF